MSADKNECCTGTPPCRAIPVSNAEAMCFQREGHGTRRASSRDMRTLLLLAFSSCLLLAAPGPGMVRSVEFQKFQGVSVKEIVQRLNDRDIQLVERPYDAQYIATAQQIVEE